MKRIKLTLLSILIGMTFLCTISDVYGDTSPQVKTDVGITFIDGSPTSATPSSKRLLPLGEKMIPSIIFSGLALLALGRLIVYIRKKGILKHEKK